MAGLNAQSVSMVHFNPVQVRYDPKNIQAEAIQVTPENIGRLALEFEVELFCGGDWPPYFFISADRGEDQKPVKMMIRETDWIIPLRGELHVYRDYIFNNTFMLDAAVVPSPVPRLDLTGSHTMRSMHSNGD